MTNKENTEIVETNFKNEIKEEAKKQLRIAAVNALQSTEKPVQDFTSYMFRCLYDRATNWIINKLSA